MLDVCRRELKYVIRTDEYRFLSHRMESILEPDMNNGEDGYTVRSLYFDSFGNTDYKDKTDGLDHRKKIRLRIYNGDDSIIKLEIKRKDGGYQRKSSVSLSREEAERMMDADYSFLLERSDSLSHGLYTLMQTRGYRPRIVIEYDRMAYAADTNEIRVTFDSALRAWADTDGFFEPRTDAFPVADPCETTMEVKYDGFLYSSVKEALSVTDRMQISNSKYIRARNLMMI